MASTRQARMIVQQQLQHYEDQRLSNSLISDDAD
jgi:hypothetical protein